MPTETILVLCAVVGVFAFFGATIAFADLTWQRHKRGKAK